MFTEVGSFWPEDLIGDPENAGEVTEREKLQKATLEGCL